MPRPVKTKKQNTQKKKPLSAKAEQSTPHSPGNGASLSARKLLSRKMLSKTKSKRAKQTQASQNQQFAMIGGLVVCLIGVLLFFAPAPSNPDQFGGPPEQPIPHAPKPQFFTDSIDTTRRYGHIPSVEEMQTVANANSISDEEADSKLPEQKEEEEQLEQIQQHDLTPAEKRAARKVAKQAARKAAKKDIRQAGFGTVSPSDSESDYEHSSLTLADDPRFKRVFKDVDIATQAQYSSMWSAAQGCSNGVMDIECPSVHRKLHAELPDAIAFQCSASSECNDYPCVDGQCICSGTATGIDCGTLNLLHYEWNNDHVTKSSTEKKNGVPTLSTFTKMLRGATPMEAMKEVLQAFLLVQDPQQSEMDAKVQAKMKPELEFLLRATMETSPDKAVDLTELAELSLHVSLQASIWMSKNLIRYVPMPRALRLGVQEHCAEWIFDPLLEIIRWSSHPSAKPIDYARVSVDFPNHTLLSLATLWQQYPAMQILIEGNGGTAAPGSLQYAIRNHDLLALKILLTAMSPENVLSEAEQDAFGRSPLELARVAQEMAFDNLVGHLESHLSERGLEFSSTSDVVGTSSSGSEGSKKRRRTANKEQTDPSNDIEGPGKYGGRGGTFFEKAGTDVQIDCSVDVVESSELSKEQFLRDYVIPGRPLFIKGAVDHWDLSTYKISNFPDQLGDVEVAANQIPYGDQVGIESNMMRLRDFIGYMNTLRDASYDIPMIVYDTNLFDSNLLSNADYQPGSHGTEGGDKFFHHSRYHWMGDGALTDAMNTLSNENTSRWSHFFIGPKNAGGGFNSHCSMFTTVTDGKMLWMGFPPSQPAFGSAYSSEHPLEWMATVNQESPEVLQGNGHHLSNPITCELVPGYTLYNPPLWTTSTINLEPSMGMAIEIIDNCVV
jgi:hypothetical protein